MCNTIKEIILKLKEMIEKNIRFDFRTLNESVVEKDVENAYRTLFSRLFINCHITSPFGCDGFLIGNPNIEEHKNLRALLEFKHLCNLSNKSEQSKVLIQCIFYLKKFEKRGIELPNVVFIGDKKQCFGCHTNALTKYLDYNIDWSIAPCNSYESNPDMIHDIINDEDINPFIFNLFDGFNWKAISRQLIDLSTKVKRLIKVTDSNIVPVYSDFCEYVLHKKCTLSEHDKASLFIMKLTNDTHDIYLHPMKKDILATGKFFGDVLVNSDNFSNFFGHYDGGQYSTKEKTELVKIVDRIIEDNKRRRSGDFFTPTNWVNESHDMISEQLGEDWREKYVVWDCAWGTGNLTRDGKFKELYCSTLSQGEIDVAIDNNINSEAERFQYDFLNDGIINGKIDIENDPKLPQGLKEALLSGKQILFLINPPYGTANEAGSNGKSKKGMALNKINEMMKNDDWGASSQQLYAQFLYRIYKLNINNNIKIAVFYKSIHFTGSSYMKFRSKFFKKFNYLDGMLFQASHFDGVSDQWGIDFSLFESKECIDKNNFIHKLKNVNDSVITTIGEKNIYNIDNDLSFSDWIKRNIKKEKTIDAPQLSNSLNIENDGIGKIVKDSLGYYFNISNNVMKNNQEVYILSSSARSAHGISILPINFLDVVSNFTARKIFTGKHSNWINDKDEYLAPTEEVQQSELYKQYNYDSIVYSLFHSASNQSSMREVNYKDRKWDIKNEFFWISKNDIMELADQDGFDYIYYDAKNSNERYVYNLLFGEEKIYDKLSPDAKEVLDISIELVKKTFKMRKQIHQEHPEYHLNTFDAGWYQIKIILKEFYPQDLARFVGTYKSFEDRMRPLVYELGFLK